MKKILGLDLGTNSIGWALIEIDHESGIVRIIGLGSRILPMDAGEIKEFEGGGKTKSSAAQRTEKKGPRRLNERFLLRRDRLHLVLDLLNTLPEHYRLEIDFERNGEKCGQFKSYKEPKIAYKQSSINSKKYDFLFEESYAKMLQELGLENKKKHRIPKDWTLYYLRQKALKDQISLEELAWVFLSYNQKRGYEKTDSADEFDSLSEKLKEFGITDSIQQVIDTSRIEITPLSSKVVKISESTDKFGKYYKISLENGYSYKEYSAIPLTTINDNIDEVKLIERITFLNEDGDDVDKSKTIYKIEDNFELKVKSIEPKETKGEYLKVYENGWTVNMRQNNYFQATKFDKEKPEEIFVTRLYDEKGDLVNLSKKNESLNLNITKEPFGEFRLIDPNKNSNWKILKKKTEKEALKFNSQNGFIDNETGNIKKYISPQIYAILKDDAQSGNRTKIIGGMFQVVDREFYRQELNQIIETQKQFHNELQDKAIFEKCVNTLYPKNESHAKALMANKNAIQHLLVEDILLYQRPLKSKKSEIANCKYEIRHWKDVFDKNGNIVNEIDIETGELKPKREAIYHKVTPISHPYFQEFRIWDKLHSLKLIQIEKEVDGKIKTNENVTDEYLKKEDYEKLFDILNNRKSLNQSKFIDFLKPKFKENKEDAKNFVWNFPEDEELKGNETRVSFVIRFKRCGFSNYSDFLTQEKEYALWHYLYSVSYKERTENGYKSLKTFFDKFLGENTVSEEVKENLIKDFANYPKFASNYCAYSEKALKKLLPFIRKKPQGFNGNFDISNYIDDLERIKYDEANIKTYLDLTKENLETLSKEERKILENRKQNLYEALWQNSINKRIDEILSKLKNIDFNQEDIEWNNITDNISKIPFPKGLFNAFSGFNKVEDFAGLNLTQASYLVYGRHSELAQAKYWISPKQIRDELHQELKQHSLNNPVAEKVILEMMQIVADIWDYYGEGKENFFSKIHLEVGRSLKKSAKEKAKILEDQKGNKVQNKRLRQILEEFLANDKYNAIPQNTDHFERLKIVEEGAEHTKNTDKNFFSNKSYSKKEIDEILKKPYISKEDFDKYKLWIEQGYKSPYTNRMIQLSDLFDGNKYNIDHIFPQASVTNDSLSNKVVCEREINKLKSSQTGRDFVNNPKQRTIYCSAHKSEVAIVDDETYTGIVKAQFSGTKRHILLSKEIPSGFTNSQMNNARHIARKAMELLSHIVREPGEVEFRSKNVLPVTGEITSKLKKAWKLDEVWKELVAPRFIRMNELTQSNLFGSWQISKSGEKYFDCNLDETIREKDESYDIKRIDHRHHALDALIVALCTEEHVNYINNINAKVKADSFGKQKQLEKYRETLKKKIKFSKPNKENPNEKDWFYMLPGEIRQNEAESSLIDTVLRKNYFYKESYFDRDYRKMILSALQNTIVTFKQNLRVINSSINRYKNSSNSFVKQNIDNGQKKNWSIRRSLGKDTYYGKVNLKFTEEKKLYSQLDNIYKDFSIVVDKPLKNELRLLINENDTKSFIKKVKEKYPDNPSIKIYVFSESTKDKQKIASRESLSEKFNSDKIKTITDTGIQKILLNHLKQFDTVQLNFEEGIKYFDSLMEKHELEAIVNDSDSKMNTLSELIDYLKENKFKYKKADYSTFNIFVEKVTERNFRNENLHKDDLDEHPEIAFTSEEIEKMNQPDNLRKLNGGKDHTPIKKVRISRGFGSQRPLSEEKQSIKSKQYVVNDAGSNLYLGFYEGKYENKKGEKITERKFQDIGLIELIENLKQDEKLRKNPLPKIISSIEKNAEYNCLFTLSPLDLVYVPTEEEIENPTIVDFNNLSKNQIKRIYKFVDGSSEIANFIPYTVAQPIWKFHVDKNKKEIHKLLSEKGVLKISDKELIKDEFGFGSQQTKNQNMIDGITQIKKICWKLEMDRLGHITKSKQ